MNTTIELTVGGVSLDWSKNSRGADHGNCFKGEDRKRLQSDLINYDYFQQNNLDAAEMEMAFSRPLRAVVPRLESENRPTRS